MHTETIDWLLNGDVSIQYQATRDLTGGSPEDLKRLQHSIEKKGWGKKFLAQQAENGMWGGGLYGPKWISTHYTLMTLMRLGLAPDNDQAQKGCRLLLNSGYYSDGGINHFASLKHSETCVTAMTLSLLCYFNVDNPRTDDLKDFLINQQMKDGGWNCESFKGARHSSFHTTISTLEALRMYEHKIGKDLDKIEECRAKAHEFLLKHHLFRSDMTGEVVDAKMTRFSFPPRWKYDILRALDYFQELNAPHDPRFCDAITLLKKKERNGRWPLQQKHSGLIYFDMEKPGKSSRMNTLRALRVLKWWNRKPLQLPCD